MLLSLYLPILLIILGPVISTTCGAYFFRRFLLEQGLDVVADKKIIRKRWFKFGLCSFGLGLMSSVFYILTKKMVLFSFPMSWDYIIPVNLLGLSFLILGLFHYFTIRRNYA